MGSLDPYTLMFSLPQAVRFCAEAEIDSSSRPSLAGSTIPVQGREQTRYTAAGVSRRPIRHEIYTYYKNSAISSLAEVMGASFRNVGQILELAGCDSSRSVPELMEN